VITNQRRVLVAVILFLMKLVVERVEFVGKLFDWLVGRIVRTHGHNTLINFT
jgi:hypothetical protein